MYDILELNKQLVPELREIAKELNIRKVESYKKQDLVYKILDTQYFLYRNPTNEYIIQKSFNVVNRIYTIEPGKRTPHFRADTNISL